MIYSNTVRMVYSKPSANKILLWKWTKSTKTPALPNPQHWETQEIAKNHTGFSGCRQYFNVRKSEKKGRGEIITITVRWPASSQDCLYCCDWCSTCHQEIQNMAGEACKWEHSQKYKGCLPDKKKKHSRQDNPILADKAEVLNAFG